MSGRRFGDNCVGRVEAAAREYLSGPGPFGLEIGRASPRAGWLTADIAPSQGSIQIDAARPFPLPSEAFDYIYTEHMIEHVPFTAGQNMLRECWRVLKNTGTIRVVTPSIGFLLRVISVDRGELEQRYLEWSLGAFVPEAPIITPAFFLNNFVRNWGHQFLYDRQTLRCALEAAYFGNIIECELAQSDHPMLSNLENAGRMPPGFLALESMIFEGTKQRSRVGQHDKRKGANVKIPPPLGRLMPSLMIEGDFSAPHAKVTCIAADLRSLLGVSLTPVEIDEAMALDSLKRRAPSAVIEGNPSDGGGRVTCALEDFRALLEIGLASVEVDEGWYLKQYPDVQAGLSRAPEDSAKAHYRGCGFVEGRLPCDPAVDEDFYRSSYPDVAAAIARMETPDAKTHYVQTGYREGRLPSAPSAGRERIPAANGDRFSPTTDRISPHLQKNEPVAADHRRQQIRKGGSAPAKKKLP